MEKIIEILNQFGIPFATVYLDIDVVNIELYTDKKDPELEKKLQGLLTESGFVYEKNEAWIESEKLYEVVYEFEMEA